MVHLYIATKVALESTTKIPSKIVCKNGPFMTIMITISQLSLLKGMRLAPDQTDF